jgi:CheY-like chemotaxis protein
MKYSEQSRLAGMWIAEIFNRGSRRPDHVPEVLAITCDHRLYYLLLSASIELHWKITWARSIGRAHEICRKRPRSLIVHDQQLPGVDWRDALEKISGFPERPMVLLAASDVTEEIWEGVLQRSGYDAVRRSACSAEWMREMRFASLSQIWNWANCRG